MNAYAKFASLVALASAATVPALWLKADGAQVAPTVAAAASGLAILGAGFLLSWSAETAESRLTPGLVLAILALITVLPEYAVDIYYGFQAGRHPEADYVHYAAANMTGANRLLVGVGWPLVAFLHWRKTGEPQVRLRQTGEVEIVFLLVASLYAFFVLLRDRIGLLDTVVLLAIYGVYLRVAAASRPGEAKDEEEAGPAAVLERLPAAAQWTIMAAMAAYAAIVVVLCAEPFAESMVAAGRHLGIDEFLLIQWIAPLASEAPTITIVLLFVAAGRAAHGMSTMVSDKINQWTLLVGMLPLAVSAGAGALESLPLGARQHEEFFLTAAQSVFALSLLLRMRLSLLGAGVLAVLFVAQLGVGALLQRDPAGTVRALTGFAWLYLALAIGSFAFRRRELVALARAALGVKWG